MSEDGQPRFAPHLAALLRERDELAAENERLRERIDRVWDVYYAEFGNRKMSARFTALIEALAEDAARRGAAGEGEG